MVRTYRDQVSRDFSPRSGRAERRPSRMGKQVPLDPLPGPRNHVQVRLDEVRVEEDVFHRVHGDVLHGRPGEELPEAFAGSVSLTTVDPTDADAQRCRGRSPIAEAEVRRRPGFGPRRGGRDKPRPSGSPSGVAAAAWRARPGPPPFCVSPGGPGSGPLKAPPRVGRASLTFSRALLRRPRLRRWR